MNQEEKNISENASPENVIEIDGVSKRFKETAALTDIHLRFESGKIYGLVGHNGSGKTVLLKCICGFLHCDEGEIRVNGKVMGKQLDMLHQAGIIIEEPAFLRSRSGYDNLKFLYMLRHKNDKQHLYHVMEKVGLDPASRKYVAKYSLGMRQRLAIAQAIMEDPDILILDEPMNGLDRNGIAQMRELFLQKKAEGKLILFASHNKEDIEALCDEVYRLEDGKIVV